MMLKVRVNGVRLGEGQHWFNCAMSYNQYRNCPLFLKEKANICIISGNASSNVSIKMISFLSREETKVSLFFTTLRWKTGKIIYCSSS